MKKDNNGDIYSESNALDKNQIKNFYDQNIYPISNIEFSFKFLSEAVTSGDELPSLLFIHTGDKKDEYNNGYTDHWILLLDNIIFDSYGYQHHYNLAENLNSIIPTKLQPTRIQSFNTVCCGEYCLDFCKYIYQERKDEYNAKSIGKEYCNNRCYTTDTQKNDETVLGWYHGQK